MTSSRLHHRTQDWIDRLCSSDLDERALRAEILAELGRLTGRSALITTALGPADR